MHILRVFIQSLTSGAIANCLQQDVICRRGCFGKLEIDGGSETKEALAELAERYGVKRLLTYQYQANGMIN